MTKPKSRGKADEGSPGWMLTMGDMNTLLLTFFVILVSKLNWEDPAKAAGEKANVGLMHKFAAEGEELRLDRGQLVRKLQEATQQSTAEVTPLVVESRYVPVSLEGPSSYVVTVGAQYGAFREGDYRLMQWTEKVLDLIREAFAPYGYVIIIRAHTSGWRRDSVVPLRDGSLVPFAEAEARARARGVTPPEEGDHIELSFLRAKEVFRYLTTESPETHLAIAPHRLRLEAVGDREIAVHEDGYVVALWRGEAPRDDFGAPNRRVDVIIKTEETRTGR